jgi:hypothetical protein
MKTKEKLLTLVKNVGKALGIEGTAISSSSEIPSVWNGRQVKEQLVYYSRDVVRQKQLQSVIAREFDLAERIKSGAEHERHLILFARIDAEHFTIGLRFTRFSLIDNRNLLARMESEPDRLDALIEAVTPILSMGGTALTRGGLKHAIEQLGAGSIDAVELSKSWDRTQALGLGEEVEGILISDILACKPLFEAALWSETNDCLALSATLEELSEQVNASVEAKTQQREAKAEAHAERAEKARQRTGAKIEAEQAWRRMQHAKRPGTDSDDTPESASSSSQQSEKPPRKRGGATSHTTGAGTTKRAGAAQAKTSSDTRRSSPRKPTAAPKKPKTVKQSRKPRKEPKKAWAVGDECALSRGLFMGKRGQVVAAPQGGYVKVKVGVIEVSVSVLELDL